jgi:RNA polymerase sigma-70 factor (ECF subfamily)
MSSPDFVEMRDRLVHAVRQVCPGWLRNRAEDIVQNALVKLLQGSAGEASAPPAASYLWKVAYSATVDEIRRLRRRPEVPWEAEDPGRAEPADPSGTDASGLDDAVDACLQGLPEPRRIAVGLHLAGFSAKEIAVSLHWTDKAARNLVFRGMVALRECLSGKGFHA